MRFIKKYPNSITLKLLLAIFSSVVIACTIRSEDSFQALIKLFPDLSGMSRKTWEYLRGLEGPSNLYDYMPATWGPEFYPGVNPDRVKLKSVPSYNEVLPHLKGIITGGTLSPEAQQYYLNDLTNVDGVFLDMFLGAGVPPTERQKVFDFLAQEKYSETIAQAKEAMNHPLEYFNPMNIYNYAKRELYYEPKWRGLKHKGHVFGGTLNGNPYQSLAGKSALGLGSLALLGFGAYYYNTWKQRYLRSVLLKYQQTGTPITAQELYAIESDPSFWRNVMNEIQPGLNGSLKDLLTNNDNWTVIRLLELAINKLGPTSRLYRYVRSFA